MTVVEFLDQLYDSPRDWKLAPGWNVNPGIVRRDAGGTLICPAEFVNWGETGIHSLTGPGAVPWIDIFSAADGKGSCNPKIRRALLHACGLSEEAP